MTVAGGREPKPVTLLLFNDSIASASKKSTGSNIQSIANLSSRISSLQPGREQRLSVDFIVPFGELSIQGGSDTSDEISLMRNKTELVALLQFDSSTSKKLWVDQIRKAMISYKMEEAVKNSTLNLQLAKERHARKTTKTRAAVASAGHRRAASSTVHKKAAELASLSATPDLPLDKYNRIMYMLDDLHETASIRHYDEAVEFVDQVKFNLTQLDATFIGSPRMHALREELESNQQMLADYLLKEISCLLISKKEMVHFIQLLSVLGYADQARERFLSARSDFIRKKAKYCFILDISLLHRP